MEISLPKTGNHAQLFATSGMDYSASKDQVTIYISKLMVQFLIEYEDNNGNFLTNINIWPASSMLMTSMVVTDVGDALFW